jgi:putative endonuclease
MYFVYLLRCKDNSLYCGQTNNLEKRIKEHNYSNNKSAKYTVGRRPVTLAYCEEVENISEALKREYAIKKLSKSQKEKLVQCFKNRSK